MSEATKACIREHAAASTEAQVGRGVRRHRSAPGAECAHLRCAAAPRTSSSTMTGAFMEIWSARVPSTRARSYLVMKRVVMRFSGGTAPPPPPPPVTICAGAGAWRSARARQRGRLLGRPPPRRTARRLCRSPRSRRAAQCSSAAVIATTSMASSRTSIPFSMSASVTSCPSCSRACHACAARQQPRSFAQRAVRRADARAQVGRGCARTGVRAPVRADRP